MNVEYCFAGGIPYIGNVHKPFRVIAVIPPCLRACTARILPFASVGRLYLPPFFAAEPLAERDSIMPCDIDDGVSLVLLPANAWRQV